MSLAEHAPDQKSQALAKGNRVRLAAVEIRRRAQELDLPESMAFIADLVEASDPRITGLKLSVVLLSIRQVGPTKVRQILRAARIPLAEIPVRELTPSERVRLVAVLRDEDRPDEARPAAPEPPSQTVVRRLEPTLLQIQAGAEVLKSVMPPASPVHRITERILGAARDVAEPVIGRHRDFAPLSVSTLGAKEGERRVAIDVEDSGDDGIALLVEGNVHLRFDTAVAEELGAALQFHAKEKHRRQVMAK